MPSTLETAESEGQVSEDAQSSGKRRRRDARPASGSAPLPARRRPAVIAIGIALAVICALTTWWLASLNSQSESLLVVKKHIVKGQVIKRDDLSTIDVSGGQAHVNGFTVEEAGQVYDKVATTDLTPGALVLHDSVAAQIPVPAGKSVVGVAVTAGKGPAQGLKAGDRVRVILVPSTGQQPPSKTAESYTGSVVGTSVDQASGARIVDVQVDSADAPRVAALSSAGRAGIVLDSSADASKKG